MEVAAGAVIAEEVVSTAVQGTVVAFAIAQPTGPLKAVFNQIGSAPQSDSPDSLARSSHTITAIDGDLYVFGGFVASKTLAGPEMHILKLSNVGGSGPDYKSVPPLAEKETDPTPGARAGHVTLTPTSGPYKGKLVMYGGYSDVETKAPADQTSCVWVFDPETLFWTCLNPALPATPKPGSRVNHSLAVWNNLLVLHGGKGHSSSDTWQFDLEDRTWSELPALAADETSSASPPLFTIADNKLWLITSPTDELSTNIHYFDMSAYQATNTQNPSDMASGEESASWVTLHVPTNPLMPGPSLRSGAAIHTVSTGLGRRYLLLMPGPATHDEADTAESQAQHGSLWTLQLPSSYATPAAAKDATRNTLPRMASHTLEWHAVDLVPKDEAAPGTQQRTWLGAAGSAIATNVGGAANWVARKGSFAGKKVYDLASPGARSGPTSPTVEGEPGPILEDNEAKEAAAASVAGSADAQQPPAEVQSVPPVAEDDDASEKHPVQTAGKAHPGPRSYFGSTVLLNPTVGVGLSGPSETGSQVLMWGGLNAKGEREGDGWLIELKI